MRFGLVHRIMTDALAALGLLALVSSGEIDRRVSAALVLGLVAALSVPERWQDRPALRHLGVLAPIGLLAMQIVRFFLGGSTLGLAVEFAAALQVLRLATRRGAAHDQQVIVLALLHLIAGTVVGGGLAYGLCFLGFLVVAPGALVLSHLRREVEGNYRQGARDRTGLPVDVPRILRSRRVIGRQFLVFTCLLSVPIFFFTAVLFVLFPRVGLSLLLLNHSRPERMIGFSDKVDLGGVGTLRTDPTIAMRVEVPSGLPDPPPPRLALYLRGTAFDRYDGRSWSRTVGRHVPAERQGGHVAIHRWGDPAHDRRMLIDLEPIDPPVVFLPPDAVALRVTPRGEPLLGASAAIYAGPEGALSYRSPDDRGLRYEVFLAAPGERIARPLGEAERARYLGLPAGLSPKVAGLAASWAGELPSPFEQARRIETRLRAEYRYDLASPSGANPKPLEHFLFESKRGHCEYYSTAMIVLLRTLGVPARNVTGFVGGTYNRFGRYYAVRQGDAHSWVEVFLDDRGWTRFDPTPPADAAPQSELSGWLAFLRDLIEAGTQRWDHHVKGYNLKQQVQLLRFVSTGYSGMRQVWSSPLRSPRRAAVLLAGTVLIAGAVWYLWRRRRPRRAQQEGDEQRPAASLAAVELYRSLESVLATRGVGRRASTPPLGHAEALLAMGHPSGREVLDLTHIYLEARFGGRRLDEEDRRAYARRVRALRTTRPQRLPSAPAAPPSQ